MKFHIQKNRLQDEVKKKIFEGFAQQAIESTGINGLEEDPVSFEIFDDEGFIGAIVVQPFWGQLHIKYLFVEKCYRGQGIARELMSHALDFGRQRGYHFAFVETMNFQAPEFYKKMGFDIEFSRSGYTKNTTFHYLKKNLKTQSNAKIATEITRIGVYGVVMKDEKMLMVRQKKGPHVGKLDFPGGGIEFGESLEQALRRELAEEVGMKFDSFQLIDNLSTTIDVLETSSNPFYTFYQIGMIYRLEEFQFLKKQGITELEHCWLDPRSLLEDQCSPLLWKYTLMHT